MSDKNQDLAALTEFCTVRQLEHLNALIEHGTFRKAAAHAGCTKNAIQQSIKLLRRKAEQSKSSATSRPIADGLKLKGESTLYRRGEDEPLLQWVKTSVDEERREEMIKEAISVLTSDVKGTSRLVRGPANASKDLITVIPMGDPHIGMYSWAKECGEDFDTEKAKSLTLGAVDRLMSSTPAAGTAIILPLGDVFHADDQRNVTPGHGHQLDVDTRYVKVLEIGIETFRHVVMRALETHEKVIVRFVAGNHDPHSIWALAFTISAYFSNNPRVTVDLSPSKFWFYRHGAVLLGATHGDTVKHDQLLGIMASDRAKDWGDTKHRYWYTGHVHHQSVREYPGVVCESFRTLAAKDAYAAGNGYRAGRDMLAIVHHNLHGEIERHRVDVGMIA